MECFLCSSLISAKESSESISLTRIFNFLKLDDLSSVTATCCKKCSQVCNNFTNLISEMEVIKLKISDSVGNLKELIKFRKRNKSSSIVGHQDILRKTKEKCIKYLQTEIQPAVVLKRLSNLVESVQLFHPINSPKSSSPSSSTSSANSKKRRRTFSCHYCSHLNIPPKFHTKEEQEKHKLVTHVHQIFSKSRPRKLHFTEYRKCLDDLIENEVISTTRRVRDKKFSVCICQYCPPNTRKYFNQNSMYFHLMEYHRFKFTAKLEKALYELLEEDEEPISDTESETCRNKVNRNGNKRSKKQIVSSSDSDRDHNEATNFIPVSVIRNPRKRKRPVKRSYRNPKVIRTSSLADDKEVILRKKTKDNKAKTPQFIESSSSSSCSSISSTASSSVSSQSSPKPNKLQEDDDPAILSDKADSLFSIIPSDQVKTRRKLKF